MKRRSFIRKLLALVGISIIAPELIAENNNSVLVPKYTKFTPDGGGGVLHYEYYKTHKNITMSVYCNHMAGKTDGSAIIEDVASRKSCKLSLIKETELIY